MPGFPVFTTLQPIVGVDFHKAIPPVPAIMTPHVVVWGSGLSQKAGFMWANDATSKASSPESGVATPVLVGSGHACGRTHDAGPHPGHIWPNALLPIILLGSASKAEFGAGTVQIAVSKAAGGHADFAVNVAYAMNLNLDCQDFPLPPMPTGFCIAVNYTVYAGFSFMDFLRGLIQLAFDLALTWVVNFACCIITGALSGAMKALLGKGAFLASAWGAFKGNFTFAAQFADGSVVRSAQGLMNDGAGWFASNGRLYCDGWRPIPAALVNTWKAAPADETIKLVGTAVGTFGLGTPTGYAPENARLGGWGKSSAAFQAGTWINKPFR